MQGTEVSHPAASTRRGGSPPRTGGAFTLVELLVVVAIIALLVTMLMPALGRAMELARKTACMTQLKNLGTSFRLYWQDYNHHNPFVRYPYSTSDDPVYWPWFMREYVGGGPAEDDAPTPADKNAWAAQSDQFQCVSAKGRAFWCQPEHPDQLFTPGARYTPGIASLGINFEVSCPIDVEDGWCYPSMLQVPHPDRVGLLMDSGRAFFRYGTWGHHPFGNNSYDPRHLDTVNIGMADGHVEDREFDWFYPYNDEACRSLKWYAPSGGPSIMD